MGYLSDLISAADSPAAAYLEFLTEKNREAYAGFAFVEDDDDIIFYQHALSNLRHICFLGCGGKNGVIAVFERLKLENREKGHLFFVDRDSEAPPFKHADEILRTTLYSWESHFCRPELVSLCLQRHAEPNLTRDQARQVEEAWVATMEAFRGAFSLHSAMLRHRADSAVKLGLRHIRFSVDAVPVGDTLSPGVALLEQLSSKRQQAKFTLVTEEAVDSSEKELAGEPVLMIARGKTLFELLRRFIAHIRASFAIILREQINSPKHVMAVTRWDDPDFDYIRAYAAARLAH